MVYLQQETVDLSPRRDKSHTLYQGMIYFSACVIYYQMMLLEWNLYDSALLAQDPITASTYSSEWLDDLLLL